MLDYSIVSGIFESVILFSLHDLLVSHLDRGISQLQHAQQQDSTTRSSLACHAPVPRSFRFRHRHLVVQIILVLVATDHVVIPTVVCIELFII